MMYDGTSDMAVCDGKIFNGSYVDTASFKANGALNYQNPSNLEYGKVMNVTKQAPGSYIEVPEGTVIKTLEGNVTVKAGQVVSFDIDGNPYVQTIETVLKRNVLK